MEKSFMERWLKKKSETSRSVENTQTKSITEVVPEDEPCCSKQLTGAIPPLQEHISTDELQSKLAREQSDEDAEREVEEMVLAEESSLSSENEEIGENTGIKTRKRKLWHPKLEPEKLLREFPWLDTTKGNPFCKLCTSKITGGKFHLKRHERSAFHIKMVNRAKKTPKVTAFLSKPDSTPTAVKKAEIKLCAYVCRRNLAFLTMDTLPLLCKDIYNDSRIAKEVKMKRKKATQIVVGVLAPYFRKTIVDDLRQSMFTIIIDETTDISVNKSLIIIVRYWNSGSVKDRVFDLVEVESGHANVIFEVVKKVLDENAIPYENVTALGADGASVMMGNIKGVQARLKEIVPNLYVQTCLCHSLHLCTSYASKQLPNVIEQFVRDIYGYFRQSTKRSKELAECQIFANEKPHKMLHPCQTRWLSLKAVVDRILEQWNPLILFFQRAALEDDLPTAKTILNALRNHQFKIYLLFLSYILDLVVTVNKELQSECSKFPILLERMTTLYKTILRNFIKNDILQTEKFNVINVSHPRNMKELETIYCGAKVEAFIAEDPDRISGLRQEINDFRKHALKYYIELCNQIKSRFNFDDKYVKFAQNFSPSTIKLKKSESIANFYNLFPQIKCDIEKVNSEYRLLIDFDTNDFPNNVDQFWERVSKIKNELDEDMFPNLMIAVRTILILPHSSAAAERGFSQYALNKTKIRNRLALNTSSAILVVKDALRKYKEDLSDWEPCNQILARYNPNIIDKIDVEDD